LALIIYFAIKSHFAYEMRLIRSIDRINIYLLNNSYVNETNLIEFNKKMKKVPKILRYHWQQYMLFREKAPSFYMSTNNVIEKPLKTSSLNSNRKTLGYITLILVVFTAIVGCGGFGTDVNNTYLSAGVLFKIAVIPVVIILLKTLYTMFQELRQSAVVGDLYHTFHIFQRLIDKAATTIPEYVDFEVLFTKKEIKKGIPVLNEYLEKRARQEQEELEKARINAVEHEVYDFGEVDINGELILERSMKETEVFLSLKSRLLLEIQDLEKEIESRKKAFDNDQKDYQKKLQASKENIERFRTLQESLTSRLESNYNKKQQTDEIKKQQQIEKDNDDNVMVFKQDMISLNAEIEKRKAELDKHREYIEEAMESEYKTYSTKIYKNLIGLADEREKEEKEKLKASKDSLEQEAWNLNEKVDALSKENAELKKQLENVDVEIAERDNFYKTVLKETAEKAQSAIGKKGDRARPEPEKTKVVVEDVAPLNPKADEIVYDEFGGYYDAEGYYRYQNGTYYDPAGNFFDDKGGHFDKDGNYFAPEVAAPQKQAEKQVIVAEPVVMPKAKPDAIAATEKPIAKEIVYDEFGGYYDAEGYYRYQNGTYYDPAGNFYDGKGGFFDKDGNYLKTASDKGDKGNKVDKTAENAMKKSDGNSKAVLQTEEAPVEAKRKAGRPKKVGQVETPIENAPKRKAGRPKKVVSKEEEIVKEKKPVGRPKKAVDASVKVATEKKKSVGRPKKIVSKEELDSIANKPKRKAGRPKKVVATKEKPDAIKTLDIIQNQIANENEKLQKQQEELDIKLNETIDNLAKQEILESTQKREKEFNQIKIASERIAKQAEIAQKNSDGEEIQSINDALEDLVDALKKFQEEE
ncbi:MAG: hypothetical protein RR400_02305, partial [Clostridia bacterium]